MINSILQTDFNSTRLCNFGVLVYYNCELFTVLIYTISTIQRKNIRKYQFLSNIEIAYFPYFLIFPQIEIRYFPYLLIFSKNENRIFLIIFFLPFFCSLFASELLYLLFFLTDQIKELHFSCQLSKQFTICGSCPAVCFPSPTDPLFFQSTI